MPQIITVKGELIRLNLSNNTIEYSTTGGRAWFRRFLGSSNTGTFIDLIVSTNEIIASTTKGVYYSRDSGRTWFTRSKVSSGYGEFTSLQLNGTELLGLTAKGLFFSRDQGRTWFKRGN